MHHHLHGSQDSFRNSKHDDSDNHRDGIFTRFLTKAVLVYQRYLSPLKGGSSCRFEPTCSAFALQSLKATHPARAVLLTVVRLSKCGPWHPGGFDPPPGWQPDD